MPNISPTKLLQDKWNDKYSQKLSARGPGTLRSGNMGASYLVAPIYAGKPNFKRKVSDMAETIRQTNQKYLDAMLKQAEEKLAAQPGTVI